MFSFHSLRFKIAPTIKYAKIEKNPAKFDRFFEIYTLFTHFLAKTAIS